MNIAVFGSAFNPPTKGHQDAINFVLEDEKAFDKVLLIPSLRHAFSKQMIDYATRKKLVSLFVSDINDPRVIDLLIEHKVKPNSEQPVYTYDLLDFLEREMYPNAKLTFVIGPDNKANWDKFYKADEITERWSVLSVPERLPLRSTMARENIKKNLSVDKLLTKQVAEHINAHDLYKGT
ncbi:nicotinate-nicotinamide nucleotide adenylyltransferase [Glaciecola sp. XM2]|uniref:nicotinate-nicotinamide nucleotide adenylyltransferase n=1 Tax=Glaciecola sp. XM2 TaxID=1914931 RepID=UPI001BDEE54F|nr:nicotinate-nicotinamide nucleotide adenylyltransferase [Glaciecola sp. XM2]MBT1451698.1 nicotinate-nicotinamide nucleotide adenylyltransferase [Glaciecola sp. XM2]